MKLFNFLTLLGVASSLPAVQDSHVTSVNYCPNPQAHRYFSQAIENGTLQLVDNQLHLNLKFDDLFVIDNNRKLLLLFKEEFSVIMAHWFRDHYSVKPESVVLNFDGNYRSQFDGTYNYRLNWNSMDKLSIDNESKDINILVGDDVVRSAMEIILLFQIERHQETWKDLTESICGEQNSDLCQYLQDPKTDLDQIPNKLTYSFPSSHMDNWSKC